MTTQLYLSYAYYYWGNYHAAITTLYEALTTLPALPAGVRLGAAFPAAVLHRSLAQALTELGRFDEGIVHGHEAIKAAELAQHPFSLAQACRALAGLYLCQGTLTPAIALFQRAQRICQEADLPFLVQYTVACLGWAYAQAGDPEEALPYLEQNRHTIASHRSESANATMMLVRGSAGYLAVGHRATAIPLAQAALTLARERQERGFEAYALHLLGTIAGQHTAPDVTAATGYYQQALALGPGTVHAPVARTPALRGGHAGEFPWPACRGGHSPVDSSGPLSRHGDDLLAAAGRNRAGAGGGAVMDTREILLARYSRSRNQREMNAGVLPIICSYLGLLGRAEQEDIMGRTPASRSALPPPLRMPTNSLVDGSSS